MSKLPKCSIVLILALVLTVGYTAADACTVYVGDYVWYDANGNGLQDEDASDGLNDVMVRLYRDVDCNGIVDGDDYLHDYAFTGDDLNGDPGFYQILAVSMSDNDWCYIAEVDETTVPEDLFATTDNPLTFALSCAADYLDADFGFSDTAPVECGDCEGKVTQLTLRYLGDEAAYVEVFQKKVRHPVFEGMVDPGGEFTFDGVDRKGTLGTEIKVFADGDLNAKIHTSCSQPIGPGLVRGEFEVVDGYSRGGGLLCPVDPDDDGDDDDDGGRRCGCRGKVVELTLVYLGDSPAYVEVIQRKRRFLLFEGIVYPGEEFTFDGMSRRGTMGPAIKILVDDVFNTRIHTSCSRPIGPGLVRGDFEVVDGYSRRGGPLCPL